LLRQIKEKANKNDLGEAMSFVLYFLMQSPFSSDAHACLNGMYGSRRAVDDRRKNRVQDYKRKKAEEAKEKQERERRKRRKKRKERKEKEQRERLLKEQERFAKDQERQVEERQRLAQVISLEERLSKQIKRPKVMAAPIPKNHSVETKPIGLQQSASVSSCNSVAGLANASWLFLCCLPMFFRREEQSMVVEMECFLHGVWAWSRQRNKRT